MNQPINVPHEMKQPIDINREMKQLREFLKSHSTHGFFNAGFNFETEDIDQTNPFIEISPRKSPWTSQDCDFRWIHVYGLEEAHEFRVRGSYFSDETRVIVFEILVPINDFYELVDHFINWVNAPGFIPIEELVEWYTSENNPLTPKENEINV